MKTKLILHIGMQRTGTTFLQREVFPKLNIRYISPEFFKKYGNMGTLVEYYSYILKKDTLISNENIYCEMWSKKDTRFERIEIIHKLFPHAKIIFGIRDKESLIKSWYKKSIIAGATWSYEEFLNQMNMEIFDYEPYINYLYELFENVYIYKYEDFKKNPRKIINELCEFIGVETPEISEDTFHRKWNIGYTEWQIKIARIFNKIFKTELNKRGIIPLNYIWHPHRIIFQKDLIFKLESEKLLPVYEKNEGKKK